MTQALYRKWRPRKWDEVVGQQHIVQTLRNAVTGERVAHAYLFSGPRGTGKTTLARLLAKAVNCLAEDLAARPCNTCAHCTAVNEGRFLDLIEIDAASQTGVEDVRDLRDKINFSPNQGKYKVYVIDEVHMFSTSAFNALLKTLEEPPPHAIFVLATTEMHKIPATVLSRCQRHEFRRVPVDDIVRQLDQIAQAEGIQAEAEALTLIARQSTGSLRDGISLLDQMASTGQKISLELTQTVLGTATTQTVLDLLDAILDNRPDAGLEAIHRSLDTGVDARLLARQIVDYLRAMLLVKLGNEAQVDLGADTHAQVKRHAEALPAPEILRMTRLFNAAATDLRGGWQPSLSLELALAEAMQNPQAVGMPSAGRPCAAPTRSATGGEKRPETRSRPEVPPRNSLPSRTDVPPVFACPGGQARAARTVSRPAQGVQDKPPAVSSAPSAPPLESAAENKSATGAVSLDQVAKAWRQVRGTIRAQNPALEALLNSCKLLEIKEGTLMLGFASDLLRSKMDTPEQLDATRRVIAEVLGVNLTVRCRVSNAKQSTPPDVKQDGMVAAALKAGGEIVDIQD
ncbi:MAG: DNA polymerase III subunit gamma/tau [Anaerolineales bacterium]|nr:DNA polymerase III subunit gamma/tau [Anaerolineales bacterium]